MAQAKTSGVWGVNENGEIVAALGSGTGNVTGFLQQDQIPTDADGKLPLAGLKLILAGTVSVAHGSTTTLDTTHLNKFYHVTITSSTSGIPVINLPTTGMVDGDEITLRASHGFSKGAVAIAGFSGMISKAVGGTSSVTRLHIYKDGTVRFRYNNSAWKFVAEVGAIPCDNSDVETLPLAPQATALAGGSAFAARSDHVHPSAIATSTPASATATGTAGTIVYDADYVYVCVATNTWKRAALATW